MFSIDASVVDVEIRCRSRREWTDRFGTHRRRCDKLLIEYAPRPWRSTCPRCGFVNLSQGDHPDSDSLAVVRRSRQER